MSSSNSSSHGGRRPRGRRTRGSVDRHLPGYELQQNVLGEGTYAKVYLARHHLTGHRVAVKVLQGSLTGAVAREVEILRLLQHHPHVIRLYEAVATADGSVVYMIMELAESGELYDHVVSSHGLDEGEARRVFQQIVSAVAYCHRNRVVHHDLKLENVLLDSAMNVKIVDFGFSNFFGPDLLPAPDCGSRHYAAPELLERTTRTHLDPHVDSWSCGVILFSMLCGRLPFDGPDDHTINRWIIRGELRFPWHITLSDQCKDLISSMLELNPRNRMPMDDALRHPWFQPSLPRHLALPPLDAHNQILKIDDGTIEDAVRMFGFDKDNLLESLRNKVQNEATVAYHLMLDQRFDAPTRYLWTMVLH